MSVLVSNKVFHLSKSIRGCLLFLRSNYCKVYQVPGEPIEPNTISNEDIEKQRRHHLKDYDNKPEQLTVDTKMDTAERLAILRKDAQKMVRFKQDYPDFLPQAEPKYRDRLMEIVEREDMLKRRRVVEIPLFFVGSILSVTVADKFGKESHFLGICIKRSGNGLRHNFTLRNVIDEQGVEVCYDMYSPLLQKVEVMRLEKRLDDNLEYLRDAPLEYSYFPQDMKKELILREEGSQVPVNPLKVKLNCHPWSRRYERLNLRGVQYPLEYRTKRAEKKLTIKKKQPSIAKPWERWDLMKHYRESINPDHTKDIMRTSKKKMAVIAEERLKKRQLEEEEIRRQKSRKGSSV